MRLLLLAASVFCFVDFASAAPRTPAPDDPNLQCVLDNFQQTNEFVRQGTLLRSALASELDKAAPEWVKLRRMIVNLRESDILFRKEMYRVELMCLDKIESDDRISSLRREFRKTTPPPIVRKRP